MAQSAGSWFAAGVIYAEGSEGRRLARVLGTVVDLTQRKITEEQLRRQNDSLKLLAKTAELLLTADDPSGMMNDVFAAVQQHLNLDGYVNYRTDENEGALVLEAFAGVPSEVLQRSTRLEIGESLSGMVAQTGSTIKSQRTCKIRTSQARHWQSKRASSRTPAIR